MVKEDESHIGIIVPSNNTVKLPSMADMESRIVLSEHSTTDNTNTSLEKTLNKDTIASDEENPRSPGQLAKISHFYNGDYGDVANDTNLEPLDETEMQRHLNDVESSFVPALSPVFLDGKNGSDDTYIFDKLPYSTEINSADQNNKDPDFNEPSLAAHTTPRDDGLSEYLDDTSRCIETTSSSPAEAAAARSISRAVSIKRHTRSHDAQNTKSLNNLTNVISNQNKNEIDTDRSNKRDGIEFKIERSISQNGNSNGCLNNSNPTEVRYEMPLTVHKRTGKRTKVIRKQRGSQHSPHSSLDGSDVTLEADFASQPGGSMPARGLSRHSSRTLSRSMSLGSMASGFESSADDLGRGASLVTLTEEERKSVGEISPPETPRAPKRDLSAPTDTVIARHVRNVHVPEAVVKEYKSKNEMVFPGRRTGLAGSSLGRVGKNLTLKEQSSTIERLSKENFDLKLKVMFLSDRLERLSEEGVKDMISENVDLKSGLAVMQRDNKALRRKIKELEKQLKSQENRPSTSHSSTTNEDIPKWDDDECSHEREELIYLREKVEEYVTEIEKLRSDAASKENDRRNLAEVVREMGERRSQDVEVHDETDIWKDLLEQESSRCERISEENKRLREENVRLKTESNGASGAPSGLNHTTNIYNITKKRQVSPVRPKSSISDRWEDRNGSASVASTLVDELKKESENLRQENVNLRREVGAQTSMLTSRNREKERLYQEIEELKLCHRRNSVVGDTLVEQSVSRSNQRSISRTSGGGTKLINFDDFDREDLENKNAELRDGINSMKILNQDLRRELESCMEDFETAVHQKKKAESIENEMREALEAAETDILTLQAERDDALHRQEDAEISFETIIKEAQQEIDSMSLILDEANAEIERLLVELTDTTENFNSLQGEMRDMSQALVRLEDDHDFNIRRIRELEKDLEEANRELGQLEKNLAEANEKSSRLTVQQESCQGEIVFLREEQESDKIKIGNLETALKTAELTIDEEKRRVDEISQKLANERSEREASSIKERKELQQLMSQLNRELLSAKDEAKRLRRKDVEAAEWKQKLVDLEEQLRTALGEIDGTRSSFLQSIAKLHHELEDTVHDLDRAKESLAQKDRIIKERDDLLEDHALEARKLADILDKERQCHRNTKHQFETFQKTSLHTIRGISQQESRVVELEGARQQYRRKILSLENQLKEQMTERNQLLLTLWKRLSDLCGSDWAHDNSLINGRALPSMESVTTMLPGFSRNILAAVKKIESLFKDFTLRILSVEKDLWKEYETLESNLEVRTKKLDHLETLARENFINNRTSNDITPFRTANDVPLGAYQDENSDINSTSLTYTRLKSGEKSRNSVTRHYSASSTSSILAEPNQNEQIYRPPPTTTNAVKKYNNSDTEPRTETVAKTGGGSSYPGYYDPKWAIRLYELEEKYKAEREARIMDRTAARQRLDEKNQDNQELVQEIERLKTKIQMVR